MAKGSHNFPRVISPKVNVIEQLKFEFAYYNFADQHVSHYAIEVWLIDRERERERESNRLIINRNWTKYKKGERNVSSLITQFCWIYFRFFFFFLFLFSLFIVMQEDDLTYLNKINNHCFNSTGSLYSAKFTCSEFLLKLNYIAKYISKEENLQEK